MAPAPAGLKNMEVFFPFGEVNDFNQIRLNAVGTCCYVFMHLILCLLPKN